MNITYGRLSPYELEKQGSNPVIEQGGRRYRITELVPRLDGGANYQAVETEPVEAEVVLVDENVAQLVVIACEGPPCRCGQEKALEAGRCFAADLPPELPWVPSADVPSKPPILGDWAKAEGLWKGRGPIPKDARERYLAEFGVEG